MKMKFVRKLTKHRDQTLLTIPKYVMDNSWDSVNIVNVTFDGIRITLEPYSMKAMKNDKNGSRIRDAKKGIKNR